MYCKDILSGNTFCIIIVNEVTVEHYFDDIKLNINGKMLSFC